MEIWIRSQDKEKLYLVKDVQFCIYKKGFFERNKTLREISESEDAYCVYCNGEFFGVYPTKERCLEIIDEIQSLFCDFILATNVEGADALNLKKHGVQGINYYNPHISPEIKYYERSSIVYEMPKE